MGRFLQSKNEFPMMVTLGDKIPSWALKRWRGNGGLRFLPSDDEGFILRGDKRRLEYRGRRRSHRFSILGDGAFEYDVVLLREPESNVITLRMEGAESFDFFKQPDFISDPFLRGSFAVYKKETLIGEGTGKLCHIHRPEVIDARGRRCWGELAVVGNELRITIPANWLGEAKYPILVDPTIGTKTVGTQNAWPPEWGEDPETVYLDCNMVLNKFYVFDTFYGSCTAYAYTNEDDSYAKGRPILYSDKPHMPYQRRSANESLINFRVGGSYGSAGWRTGSFTTQGSITNGGYIWFGITAEYMWYPRFDFGTQCYYGWWDDTTTPDYFPDDNLMDSLLFSMYFDYAAGGQNYTRKLIQGITLTDSRNQSREMKRKTTQTAGVTSLIVKIESLSRKCLESVNIESGLKSIKNLIRIFRETITVIDIIGKFGTFSRKCIDTVTNIVNTSRFPMIYRNIIEQVNLTLKKWEMQAFSRFFSDGIIVESNVTRKQTFIRNVEDVLSGIDNQEFAFLFYRCVKDTTAVILANHGIRIFYREVKDAIINIDSVERGADFFRYQTDGVHVESSLFRKASLFIRIVAQLFIHDLIRSRFLRAKSEIILKSCVTRELTLESKIN